MNDTIKWTALATLLVATGAAAADLRPTLAEVPVMSMRAVGAADYKAAAALAARGGAPVEIALRIAGRFEGVTQQIIQVNEGVEGPTASRVIVLRDGLLDDSVRGVRWDIALQRTQAGAWKIADVQRAWRCRRGGEVDRFIAGPLPLTAAERGLVPAARRHF